jgi:NADH-quinone oxidoreductase subunit N
MVVGAFAVVTVVGQRSDDRHDLAHYRDLGRSDPWLSALLTLFLLAQAGVPLTAGFVAKLSVFSAAVDAGQYALALVGMVAAVVSAFVYLRIVIAMYSGDAPTPRRRARVDLSSGLAMGAAALAMLVLGTLPGSALDFARDATMLLAGAR